jgi:predicted kinase
MCGLPGAGKSTLGRRLEREMRAVRLCPDEWMGRLGIDLWDEGVRERLEVLFWELAQDLLRRGQSVILESGFWLRSDRDEKRLGARALGAAVELRFLDVPLDELWRRVAARNARGSGWGAAPITRADLEHWSTLFEPPTPTEQDLFDDPL